MPVGVSKWRAGIVHINPGFQLVTFPRVLLLDLLQSKCLTLHSLNGAVVLFPASMVLYFTSVAISANQKWLELRAISSKVLVKSFAAFQFFFYIIPSPNKLLFCYSSNLRKQLHWKVKLLLQDIECLDLSLHFYSQLSIILSGDIEENPGPNRNGFLKFCHWNLNSISAREQVKIPVIEAYNSVHRYDIFTISETMLNSTVHNDDIFIEGFSREIYRRDHVNSIRSSGVCIYDREGLAVHRRKDLELLNEIVCVEVNIARKKILFFVLYRNPSQNVEEFEILSLDYKQ